MSQPVQNLRHACEFRPLRQDGAVDHQHRHTQRAGRIQLGPRPRAARVLGHDQFGIVPLHQCHIAFHAEGTARNDHVAIGHRQLLRLIDQSQQVMVLRLRGEIRKVHSTNRQKDALGGAGKGPDSRCDIRDVLPTILRPTGPRRARQGHQRNACCITHVDGIAAHLRGKGVGCIDNVADPVITDITRQPRCPAEPAHARWDGLRAGRIYATCIRIDGRNPLPGDRFCQSIRFGRATKNQEVGHV